MYAESTSYAKLAPMGLRSGVHSVPHLAGPVGQASCLFIEDAHDAHPHSDTSIPLEIASGLRPRNDTSPR